MAIFAPPTEAETVELAKRLDKDSLQSSRLQGKYDRAIDYMEGKMRSDVLTELTNRFPSTQTGDLGQQIQPVMMPLAERYAAEAANAYNRPVNRYFVDEDGNETDATREESKKYQDMLAEGGYDETQHRCEQLTVVLESCGTWPQVKRGKLKPTIVLPQHADPIWSEAVHVDKTDIEDLDALAIYLGNYADDVNNYAMVTHGGVAFYRGKNPAEVGEFLSAHTNPYKWPQVVGDRVFPDGSVMESPRDLPGMMVTWWHRRKALQELIPDSDVDIVELNREINIALSVIMDEIRVQGFSVPVMKLNNPQDARAKVKHGARFPLPLDLTESFELVSAGVDYAGLVGVLKDIVRLLAMSKRMSANDFNPDGAPASSGFAKLVDALPKLEFRSERVRRLTFVEEQQSSWPLRAIGVKIGKLSPKVMGWKLRVEFADVEFPKTEDEITKRLERRIKHNLTTPAQVLAEEEGISEDEAAERIEQNREENTANTPQQQPPQMSPFGAAAGLGRRIGGPGSNRRKSSEADDERATPGRAGRAGRDEEQGTRGGRGNRQGQPPRRS